MPQYHDMPYLNMVDYIMKNGVRKSNRTATDTISVFGYQMRFDLRDGTIPLLTTKKMFTRGIIHEILWYLMGSTNIKYLTDNNVHIWDDWANESGDLNKVYGYQWRKWEKIDSAGNVTHIDQIANLVHKLKTNPDDRRLIVSAWNVADVPDMALPPCHYLFQCYCKPLTEKERVGILSQKYNVDDLFDQIHTADPTMLYDIDGILDMYNVPYYELSMILNQRSCDVGLGVPFNIVQYSILLRMLAEVVEMAPGEFIWNGGDVHIYENHVNALREQFNRMPISSPTFRFGRKITDIDDFKYEDFIIEDYECYSTLTMPVAV